MKELYDCKLRDDAYARQTVHALQQKASAFHVETIINELPLQLSRQSCTYLHYSTFPFDASNLINNNNSQITSKLQSRATSPAKLLTIHDTARCVTVKTKQRTRKALPLPLKNETAQHSLATPLSQHQLDPPPKISKEFSLGISREHARAFDSLSSVIKVAAPRKHAEAVKSPAQRWPAIDQAGGASIFPEQPIFDHGSWTRSTKEPGDQRVEESAARHKEDGCLANTGTTRGASPVARRV